MEFQSTRHTGGDELEKQPELGQRQHPPRIYVASLSDYNAGRLHGEWIDAAQEPDGLAEAITLMLKRSPTPGAEEFAIHDFENFGPVRLDEFESLKTVSRIAIGITAHGPAFAHFVSLVGTEDDRLNEFEDAYFGHFASIENYADEVLDDLGYIKKIDDLLPDYLQPYVRFDVKAFSRDLEISGDVMTSEGDGGIYVFNGHV
jgi:antirestriction protein